MCSNLGLGQWQWEGELPGLTGNWNAPTPPRPPQGDVDPGLPPAEMLIRVIDLFHWQVKTRKRGNVLGRAIP